MAKKEREELKFEIEKRLRVLSKAENGWSVEVNMVSWNGRPAKYDIRAWNEDHTRMGKGITLTEEEIKKLLSLTEEDIENAI